MKKEILDQIAREIFMEDEAFQDRLQKGLEDDAKQFFLHIAELALDLLLTAPPANSEELATLIRSKSGLYDRLLVLRKEFLSL